MGSNSVQEHYRDSLHKELANFNHKIDELTQQMSQLDTDNVERASTYQRYLDALHLKRKAVELKLEQTDVADDSVWDEIQAGIEEVWQDFKVTFKRASEEFEAGQRLEQGRQGSEP